ncbi:HD domain-containing protein [Lacipirellula parvula]|uniref:DNTP triphosphohydrolase n=1 Tax=Lacipirellula parvula TaxID=2650471 RepID=A0A5K7XKI9_9BACT|nr:HD domain-containing protein [Lacipirellula parvula]BBO35691.1 dNTP triphosphohydrolase [Lacipirellula parvula]
MQPLKEQIDAFVADHLPTDTVAWIDTYASHKIIHDALWGTFKLTPYEVALLDTPLLQRLRYLHQTGAVYLTYPSAHHTRFEHSLGVLCQSGRLCAALKASALDEGRVDASCEDNVRYAALLHDTGHGPFSHTSEQFYSSLPDMEQFQRDHPEYSQSGGGEILSALIVQSPAFQNFVSGINSKRKRKLNCDKIAQLITGTTDASEVFMSEIVHGPFDADKLDYMPRDGMFSGLKMHVDLDRLFHSIRILTANFDGESQTRIAGHLSGLSPLTQVMFNKMLLFTGMYHHHKVRAVDCMLWAIFLLATERGAKVGGSTLTSCVDFLRLTDDRLLIPELCNDDDIKSLITDIRERRIWKKALVIARNTVPPSMHNEAGESPHHLYAGVATLAGNTQEKVRIRREIAKRIWEVASKPCPIHKVWLDVPQPPGMTEAKQMWIEAPGQLEPHTLEHFIPVDKWVELYGAHQSRAHVFAPAEACKAVGEAAKKVFYDLFKLEFLDQATAFAKS